MGLKNKIENERMSDKSASRYNQIFSKDELEQVRTAIAKEISKQRGKSMRTSNAESNGRGMPISIIVVSLVIMLCGVYLLIDNFTEQNIFSRLFPNLSTYSGGETSALSERIVNQIRNEAVQGVVDLQVELYNQQRVLEQAEDGSVDLPEGSESNTSIAAQLEELSEQARGITATQQADVIDLNQYDSLLRQQERFNSLLDRYLLLTNRIRSASVGNNSAQVQREASQFRSFLGTLNTSESEVFRLLSNSGENLLSAVDSYLVLAEDTGTEGQLVESTDRLQVTQEQIEEQAALLADATNRLRVLENQVQEQSETVSELQNELVVSGSRFGICENELALCKQDL